jgi:hypothetical protein
LWDGPRTQRFRVPFLLVACASLAIPAVLEWVGILPRAYAFTGERFVIFPVLRHFSEVRIRLEMLVATVATVVVPAFFLWRTGRALEKARADMHTYLWHLNQLVPSKGRASDLDEMQPTP